MAKKNDNAQLVAAVINTLAKSPKQAAIVIVLLVIVAGIALVAGGCPAGKTKPPTLTGDGNAGMALFCSWNVENFFDDHNDPKNDDDLEDWFGSDPAMFQTKVDHLAEALLKMNDGVGPDILACVEVESERCMMALKDAINAKLNVAGMADRKYETVLFKQDNTGRRFAPGILTRFKAVEDRTRKLGGRSNGRILEGHLEQNGHELVVIAAHWTSRVTDKEDKGDRRISYANDCYGRVRAILQENADADVLVCGDFNDEFKDESLQKGLRVSASSDTVRNSHNEPKLLALFADWKGSPPGSIYGRGTWSVFDHICVTRGLLDEKGWNCDPKTANIFAPKEMRREMRGGKFEPLAFGRQKHNGERGYSDHFPVTVKLHYTAAEGK